MKSLAVVTVPLLAALVLLADPSPSQGRPVATRMRPPECVQAALDASGSFDSNWGRIDLVQTGRRITGSYQCCGGGRIDGEIDGNVIRYRWTQPGASGQGVWVIGTTGELIGSWGVGGDEVGGGAWNLRPLTGVARLAR